MHRFLLLLLLLAFAAGPAAAQQRRVALVIGNQNYTEVRKLANALADARAVARVLRERGFEVNDHYDLDRRGLLRAFDDFRARLQGGSVAVFYFAGHGVQVDGANYLLPVDIRLGNERDAAFDALPLALVMDRLAAQNSRDDNGLNLLIIDACRDNPFRTDDRSAGGGAGLATRPGNGLMTLYAASSGQAALDRLSPDDRDPNGLFTRHLLRAIRTPGLPVRRMAEQVKLSVAEAARGAGRRQIPAFYDEAEGDFVFTPGEAPAAPPTPAPSPAPRPLPAPAALPPPEPAPRQAAGTPRDGRFAGTLVGNANCFAPEVDAVAEIDGDRFRAGYNRPGAVASLNFTGAAAAEGLSATRITDRGERLTLTATLAGEATLEVRVVGTGGCSFAGSLRRGPPAAPAVAMRFARLAEALPAAGEAANPWRVQELRGDGSPLPDSPAGRAWPGAAPGDATTGLFVNTTALPRSLRGATVPPGALAFVPHPANTLALTYEVSQPGRYLVTLRAEYLRGNHVAWGLLAPNGLSVSGDTTSTRPYENELTLRAGDRLVFQLSRGHWPAEGTVALVEIGVTPALR